MYRVEIYCTDCTGIDYMGCFDGGTRFLLEKKSPDAALKFVEFDTIEAAEKRRFMGETTKHRYLGIK